MSKLVSLVLLFFASVAVANGFFIQGRPTSPSSAVFKASPVETPATAMPEVKVGDKIPSVVMMEGLGDFEKQEVNIAELIAGKKVAIFGVPGAFTPGRASPCFPCLMPTHSTYEILTVDLS